jgi:hypothetical protein
MSADYLDADLAIVAKDPDTGELKATPYFEDYLFKIIRTLGGEGSTLVGDLAAVTFESDRFYSYTGLVQNLRKQVEEIQHTINSPILDAKVKSMERKLNELESFFDVSRLEGAVRQLEIDTQGFRSLIKAENYTAVNKDWVEGRNKSIFKLPENPLWNHQVMFSNGDGSKLTILGNGNNIKYTKTSTSFITRVKGSSYHFQFFEDNVLDERYWRVR